MAQADKLLNSIQTMLINKVDKWSCLMNQNKSIKFPSLEDLYHLLHIKLSIQIVNYIWLKLKKKFDKKEKLIIKNY